MNEEEEWRPIAGTNGKYEVSSVGRIRSYAIRGSKRMGVTPAILKLGKNTTGYVLFQKMDSGKRESVLVHHLVLEAFVGPCPEGLEADHRNRIRDDNRKENLRWATRQENAQNKSDESKGLRKTKEIDGVVHYQCTQCKEWKPKEGFKRLVSKGSRCGIHSACIPCYLRKGAEYKRAKRKRLKHKTSDR